MPDGDVRDCTPIAGKVDHRNGVIVPARHVDGGSRVAQVCIRATASAPGSCRNGNNSIRIDEVFSTGTVVAQKLNSFKSSCSPQITDDPNTVTQIIGDEECIAVWADRQSGGINRRSVAVVTGGGRRCG